MSLLSLAIKDFRCIASAQVDFDSRCTVIFGDNASGKTSLLEAIQVLSCGRSFRSARLDALIRNGERAFTLHGTVGDSSRTLPLGLHFEPGQTRLRVAGKDARGFEQLAGALPALIIDPNVHQLLEEGPGVRRRFMDWGVFHVEPRFVDAWRRYQKALKQRNAALKNKGQRKVVTSWDAELVRWGSEVAAFRNDFVERLQQAARPVLRRLLNLEVKIEYRQGWSAEKALASSLEEGWERDYRTGSTHFGPHRADLGLSIEGAPAKDRVSRGQQKLLAAGLILSHLYVRQEITANSATLLLDDPAAELDVDNLGKLLQEIGRAPAQLVVTALFPATVEMLPVAKKFHVKQGSVHAVL